MPKFHYFLPVAAAVALLCSTPSRAALATSAVVYLQSDPGSWVGGAIGAPEVTWTHGNEGIFSANYNYRQGVSISYQGGDWWDFEFAAPSYDPVSNTNDGQQLKVGFYDKAQRFPFNSPTRPGLSVSGNGRGNNTLSGWFRVLEIDHGLNGELNRFAVDFRQYDESSTMSGPSLYGSLRFNSSIAINPVPEPASYAMLLAGLVMTAAVARRRQRA